MPAAMTGHCLVRMRLALAALRSFHREHWRSRVGPPAWQPRSPACRWARAWAAAVAALAVAVAAVPARADSPQEIVGTICQFCHGEGGDSLGPEFPKLAGQQPRYLRKQLHDFMSGNRQNEMMASFLPFLRVEDFPALGVYLSRQKATPWPLHDPRLAEAGKRIFEDGNTETGVPACAGCHQPDALGKEEFPRLASQSEEYILRELAHFKQGKRTNDRGRLMQVVAARMSEDEMKAVAEYLSILQPALAAPATQEPAGSGR